MARRRLQDRNIRKLTKIAGGTSYAVTLPIEMVRELGWKSKQRLVVEKQGERLIIRDWKKPSERG